MTAAAARERLRAEGPFWLGAAVVAVVAFMLRTTYVTMDDITNGMYGTLPRRIFEEATGTLAVIPLLVVAAWTARRAPIPPRDRRAWTRTLLLHAAAFAASTAVHTLLMASSRAALAPAVGFPDYRYGALHLRLLMEAPNDLLIYAGLVTARLVTDTRRRHRERERKALELERELAQSRLENLQLQLQPHFLFNALNTISSVMYEDPRAADAMLDHLSSLLRHALGRAGTAEVPLGEELQLLESYLALARARFGERLDVVVEAPDEARGAAVPPLLLQPLVENAIQHGISPAGRGQVAIRAAAAGGRLTLVVENAVPAGVAAGAARHSAGGAAVAEAPGAARRGRGLGLTITGRRLALLYGDAATLDAAPTAEGGYRVAVTIPLRATGASATR